MHDSLYTEDIQGGERAHTVPRHKTKRRRPADDEIVEKKLLRMPASFQEILNSRLFKFIVGKEVDSSPTEFLVHEEAIAQLSEPLYNMIKGGMEESYTGCATWDYVSKEMFERFAQFAYTSDYSIPKMKNWNRVSIQKEAATDDSSPSTSNRIRRWDEAEAEADPDLVIEQPDPEPFDWNDFTGKKDKKKRGILQTSALPGWSNCRYQQRMRILSRELFRS